jgi:hypothetical protein
MTASHLKMETNPATLMTASHLKMEANPALKTRISNVPETRDIGHYNCGIIKTIVPNLPDRLV